jgi:hypothetical protein
MMPLARRAAAQGPWRCPIVALLVLHVSAFQVSLLSGLPASPPPRFCCRWAQASNTTANDRP